MLLLVLHKLLVPPVPNAVALLLDDAAACTGGLRARASAAVPGEQALKGGTGGQRIAGTGRARVGGGYGSGGGRHLCPLEIRAILPALSIARCAQPCGPERGPGMRKRDPGRHYTAGARSPPAQPCPRCASLRACADRPSPGARALPLAG